MLSNPKLTISWEDKGKGRETKTDDFSQAFDDAILFALKDNAASLLRAFIDPTLFPEMQSLKTEYKKIKLAMTSKAKERDIRQKQCEFLAVMARREQYDAGINKNLNVLLIHLLASQEQYSSNESVNEENNIVSSTLEQVAEYEKYKLYQIKNQEEVKRLYKTTQDVLAQVEDQYKKLVEQHTKNKEKNKEKKQEILQRVRDNAAEPIRRFLNAHYGYLAHEELTQLEIFFREKKISLVDVMQRLKENNFSLFDLATHRQSFDVIELLLTLHSEKERETFLTAVHPECGNTLLNLAVCMRAYNCAMRLIRFGARLDVPNTGNRTAWDIFTYDMQHTKSELEEAKSVSNNDVISKLKKIRVHQKAFARYLKHIVISSSIIKPLLDAVDKKENNPRISSSPFQFCLSTEILKKEKALLKKLKEIKEQEAREQEAREQEAKEQEANPDLTEEMIRKTTEWLNRTKVLLADAIVTHNDGAITSACRDLNEKEQLPWQILAHEGFGANIDGIYRDAVVPLKQGGFFAYMQPLRELERLAEEKKHNEQRLKIREQRIEEQKIELKKVEDSNDKKQRQREQLKLEIEQLEKQKENERKLSSSRLFSHITREITPKASGDFKYTPTV